MPETDDDISVDNLNKAAGVSRVGGFKLDRVDEVSTASVGASGALNVDSSFVNSARVGDWVITAAAKIIPRRKPAGSSFTKPKAKGLNRALSMFAGGNTNAIPVAMDAMSRKAPAKNIHHKKVATAWENTTSGKQVCRVIARLH